MEPSPSPAETLLPSETLPPSPAPRSELQALFHAWFVEYNPAYLFSAALVLAGLTLVSFDLAEEGALAGLGVAAVAELYALTLIGSAAFLWRIGTRRVAVMVALLAALYQCDLTMHVETSAFLGGAVGGLGAIAWVALFALKLRLLAAALELRLSRSAWLVPTVGAASLALLPQLFRHVAPDARTTLVALLGFAVAAAALWTSRTIESAVGFDYRGRRAVRGIWLTWAGGALLHVAWWTVELGVEPAGLLPAALLLTTRWARSERAVWSIALFTLAAVAMFDVSSVPSTALMVAAVLALRAFRSPILVETRSPVVAPTEPPYRHTGREPEIITPEVAWEVSFGHAEPIVMERLLLGAAASLHLAAWTTITPGGLDLPHDAVLDVMLALVCVAFAWRGRRWQSFAPLVPLATHLSIQLGWLTAPSGAAQWGAWSIALGFALLGGGLAVSWRAHRAATTPAIEHAGPPRTPSSARDHQPSVT